MSEAEKVHPEPIEKNRRIRGSLRTNVTKLIKKIDEELASVNPNSDSLQESLTILIEREQKLGNLDDIIIFQSPDAVIETEMEHSLEYSEQIIKYKSRVNRYLCESVQVGKDEINKVPVVTSEIKKDCLCYSHSVVPPESKNNQREVASETNVSFLFPGNQSKDIPKQTIYYQTLRAQIVNNNCAYNVRIICDSASERSYICESIAERAGLKTVGKEKLKIFTFRTKKRKRVCNEASVSELKRKRITLKNCNSDLVITLEALATKTICASKISSPSSRIVELLQNQGFELSDILGVFLHTVVSGRVDILIGNDYLSAVLTGRTHRLNKCLMLYESVFGWTLKWERWRV
ncbi:DUF1758 domain-containing protein [Caerostris darwini]|uniref:DUF1758 domain-containing protein n=1 Tax=Caerostris darwini TaxID=1538125 RepID=A0AAV4VPZ1_9ARAC|nr:DUF1758 domain-containing protein [Caerostris darwini]